ncbi:hypothetical protein GDO81_014698 [Engystomops pustulosus]|uniref:G-protein coupled receptors family 1 profile domain-containing protein n=1 Tax=Engystomops pustulosus TaxID=76066 RepID=A0AAV7BC52_ENGPU|nr:hypothetical protein GDO81_014698 [Engystomops pustulosus]
MDIREIVMITIFSNIFILGIIGNGLVIWIAGFWMKKTISAVWFLHLAIADLLCCTSICLHIAAWASPSALCLLSLSLFILCKFNDILFCLNMSASVLLLTAMSIDRWVSVMLVVLFVIPFLIIFTSYVSIVLKLRRCNRPQRSQRPYRIITTVILCFFICWAPYNIWSLLAFHLELDFNFYLANNIIHVLLYLNSCINPILYVFMGQDFRHNFVRSIPFRVEKALSEPPDDPCREPEDPEPAINTNV